jgi:hypothetical protein
MFFKNPAKTNLQQKKIHGIKTKIYELTGRKLWLSQ